MQSAFQLTWGVLWDWEKNYTSKWFGNACLFAGCWSRDPPGLGREAGALLVGAGDFQEKTKKEW